MTPPPEERVALRPVLDALAAQIVVVDPAGRIVTANAAPLASGLSDVLEGRAAGDALEYSDESVGDRRWMPVQVTPVADGDGAVLVHEDITERRQGELQRSCPSGRAGSAPVTPSSSTRTGSRRRGRLASCPGARSRARPARRATGRTRWRAASRRSPSSWEAGSCGTTSRSS